MDYRSLWLKLKERLKEKLEAAVKAAEGLRDTPPGTFYSGYAMALREVLLEMERLERGE